MLPNHIANIAKIANIEAEIGAIREGLRGATDHGMSGPLSDAQLAAALEKRSKRFAIDVIRLSSEFPRSVDALGVAKQLIRASTSTAAKLSSRMQNALSR